MLCTSFCTRLTLVRPCTEDWSRARASDRPPRALPVALSGEDAGDPPGLREQVDALFLQWAQLSEEQPAEKAHNGFVGQLQQAGFLKVSPQSRTQKPSTHHRAHIPIFPSSPF